MPTKFPGNAAAAAAASGPHFENHWARRPLSYISSLIICLSRLPFDGGRGKLQFNVKNL